MRAAIFYYKDLVDKTVACTISSVLNDHISKAYLFKR